MNKKFSFFWTGVYMLPTVMIFSIFMGAAKPKWDSIGLRMAFAIILFLAVVFLIIGAIRKELD